ncbi:MAG: hypothetical protein GX610_21500 [Rhodococcus sp.]|nr:hypothetical protein [Rhodococcus sp. (in: high G+C Gram-positive bacteria)]
MTASITRQDQLARTERVLSHRLGGETDPPYVTTTENFFGWDHDQMYQAVQSIDSTRIRQIAECLNDIAGLVPFGLGVAFLKATITAGWDGDAADRALEAAQRLGDHGTEFRDSIGTVAVKLHHLHSYVDDIKIAVPPPDTSTEMSLSGSRQQAVHEAREDARQAAALALTNLYSPSYRDAGTDVPVFPVPHTAVADGSDGTISALAEQSNDAPGEEARPSTDALHPTTPPPLDNAPATTITIMNTVAEASTPTAATGGSGIQPNPRPVAAPEHTVFRFVGTPSPTAPSRVPEAVARSDYSTTRFDNRPTNDSAPHSAATPPSVQGASVARLLSTGTHGGGRVTGDQPPVGVPPRSAAAVASSMDTAVSQPVSTRPITPLGGHVMPFGARGMGRSDDTEHTTPSYLVNVDNGNELIGRIDPVGPPVIR